MFARHVACNAQSQVRSVWSARRMPLIPILLHYCYDIAVKVHFTLLPKESRSLNWFFKRIHGGR